MRLEFQCPTCDKIYLEPVSCRCVMGGGKTQTVARRKRKPVKNETVDIFTLLSNLGVTEGVLDKDSFEMAVKQTMYELNPKRRKTARRKPLKTGGYAAEPITAAQLGATINVKRPSLV